MKLLNSIPVKHDAKVRHIELYHGDLTEIPLTAAVDLLVLSAFPDDYEPTPRSLIGGLSAKGLSVAELAAHKAVDLRSAFSCWLSTEIENPTLGFKRILCFEPLARGTPPEVVGEIFQSLMPFAHGDPPISKVAMPLVATGDQDVSVRDMLEPLVDAAIHWLGLGLPVEKLKIVERDEAKAAETNVFFADLKKRYADEAEVPRKGFNYHVFISYSHENKVPVDFMVGELKRLRPDIRIFLDRNELNAGAAWQQKIFESLDDCRGVVAVYSPPYLKSKVCKEEFNIALFRHRKSANGVLLPVYLQSADLPTYMKLVQYYDCRESDSAKLQDACRLIIKELA